MGELTIRVNGLEKRIPAPCHVIQLLEHAGLAPDQALVELNELVLFRRDYEKVWLQNGDRVEIMEVAAGG